MASDGDTIWLGLTVIPAANVAHAEPFTNEEAAEQYAETAREKAENHSGTTVWVTTDKLEVHDEYVENRPPSPDGDAPDGEFIDEHTED